MVDFKNQRFTDMDKQILVTDELKKKLAELNRVSRVTVWHALNYHTNSRQAQAIRKQAIMLGGIVVGETPDFTTQFHTAEKLMVQTFTSRVKIVAELIEGGLLKIYVDEQVVETYESPTMAQLPAIQQNAQNLATQLKN